ncbi:MAG: ABC transporter permease [Pseudobdellovibrionaceae bacterium]
MNLKLAFLNLFRHRTRSALSLLTISGAIVSVVVFRGYSYNIIQGLRIFGVESQFGHLQIGNEKLWAPSSEKLKDQLSELSENSKKIVSELPGFVSISPRLSLQALVSKGDRQFGAQLVGYDPDQEKSIFKAVKLFGGGAFPSNDVQEILLGTGLQSRLKAENGETVSIVTQTVDGVVNAIDLTVRGTFQTSLAEVDNQVAYVPLKIAQTLLDTDKIENWVIRVADMDGILSEKESFQAKIKSSQPELTVKTWRDLASLYNQVQEFYDVQNFIIQCILSSLTILAVLNTVGMTVFERTGEIGTLRSLGLRRQEIVFQFLSEGILLSLFASVIGSVLAVLVSGLINASGFSMQLPGSSVPVPIRVTFVPSAYGIAIVLGLVSTLIGTIIPAWRASKLPIVDALRRNI